MKNLAAEIHELVANVCPIETVRINLKDKSKWEFVPLKDATKAQKQAAQVVFDSFDLDAWTVRPEDPDLATYVLSLLVDKGLISTNDLNGNAAKALDTLLKVSDVKVNNTLKST